MTNPDGSSWDKFEWRRQLETFGNDDEPVIASGPRGNVDSICDLGELTDTGRRTTMALGQRLRHLYVDQLGFVPKQIDDAGMFYLRATSIPRALESLQGAFWGLYPASARSPDFPAPRIVIRPPADETLYPNEANCRRFSQLSRAFAQRTADRWNNTSDMDYLNHLISKWMPDYSKRVAVDSHPRLSGIMDTINSTLAHGPVTRLPREFYDPKGREIIERIGVEEWFSGFKESAEYRALGIGSLLGDITARMVSSTGINGSGVTGGNDNGIGIKESDLKMAMFGCHDTTLAAILSSLGAFEGEKWPPYTSHLALELFRKGDTTSSTSSSSSIAKVASAITSPSSERPSGWRRLFGGLLGSTQDPHPQTGASASTRRKLKDMKGEEKKHLEDYFVRVRYNDRPMVIPGCKPSGKHLEGDESFCTLAAFKEVVDGFTPTFWKQACLSNLDQPTFPATPEPAGV
ncbi:MAG: hypothetical protein M1823_001090 [Watsoniomyces obsoletus]|nr:MAG: hypothetical protein M1823_001090 [Watsoniomyces obsoletus]